MSVGISRNLGNYDFCHPKDTQASIRVYLPAEAPRQWIGTTVEPDSIYDIDDSDDIMEVILRLEAYGKACIYSGDYQRDKATIEWAKAHELELTCQWYEVKLSELRKKSDSLEAEIKRISGLLQDTYDQITEENRA